MENTLNNEINKFEQNLVDLINESKVPAAIKMSILTNAASSLSALAQEEYEKIYANAIKGE